MVKADLTRDYYADLELQTGASENDIKKQFKKLALKYHPDRNPGREADVNSKFQIINSAHEVLTDPEQRAKYDSGRVRNNTSKTYGFASSTPTTGTRGNPWSNAGSQWAPPPKPPPTSKFDQKKPPPASSGAQRYANFATPNGATPRANQDAEARRKTYEAWESMRQPPPTRAWQPPKPVPKEFTPQSGREESNNFKHAPPPKSSRPGYEEFRAEFRPGTSSRSERTSPSRAPSSNGPQRRNGFMPATPGGDEPAASSTSAYFTHRSGRTPSDRKSVPDPPPRNAPPPDPLRQFREKTGTPYEPRLSTPYATHGGEKTNPFENLSRSKSTRGPSDHTNSVSEDSSRRGGSYDRHRSASPPSNRRHRNLSPEPGITRADSDINLSTSPKRTFSHANRSPNPNETPKGHRTPTVNPNISSDGDDSDSERNQQSFGTRSRTFAKRRAANATGRTHESQGTSGRPESGAGVNNERQHGPQSGQDTSNRGFKSDKQDEPSMYATPQQFNSSSHSPAKQAAKLATVLEEPSLENSEEHFPPISMLFKTHGEANASKGKSFSHFFKSVIFESLPATPSGVSIQVTPPNVLNPFEAAQFKLLDELVKSNGRNRTLNDASCATTSDGSFGNSNVRCDSGIQLEANHIGSEAQPVRSSHLLPGNNLLSTEFGAFLPSVDRGSPLKINQGTTFSYTTSSQEESDYQSSLRGGRTSNANIHGVHSFSFGVDSKTFEPSRPPHTAFTSNSAENISTAFSPEHWDGKFEAGNFANDKSAANGSAARAKSGDRTRSKSPVKGRPTTRSSTNFRPPPFGYIDPEILRGTPDESPMSPGGTKFTAEEWSRTFKPQNFAPPPYPVPGTSSRPRPARRSRTGSSTPRVPNINKTAGTAAMVSEDESSEELDIGSRPSRSGSAPGFTPATTNSPNAMDIDPPLEQPSNPQKSQGANGFAASQSSANEARNVPLEPSRPDWRSTESNGENPSVTPTLQKSELPRRSVDVGASRRRNTKSADEEDFKTNFDDLKNVEPLRHPATGLHSFSELTSNLPFSSQAAITLTIPRDFSSGQLDLPHPPLAPDVPSIPAKVTRPPPGQWTSYLLSFKTYMVDWDVFNTKIIMHFVARKNQVDAMKDGWLEAFGNSSLEKYKEGLKEDEKVRELWVLACDRHAVAMDKFQRFKDCMKDGLPTKT